MNNFLPAGGLSFNGGAGSDRISLTGDTFATGVVTATGPSSGTINYDGGPNITFTGLEPVDDTNIVTDYTINATNGSEQARLYEVRAYHHQVDVFHSPSGNQGRQG